MYAQYDVKYIKEAQHNAGISGQAFCQTQQ